MGVLDAIELLCDCTGNRGAVSAHGDTAAKRDVAQFLSGLPMDRGVDPSAYGSYAVKLAAGQGRLDVVRYLCELPVDRGVDPSAGGSRAFRYAARKGHLDVVRYLCDLPLGRGVDPSAIVLAWEQNHSDVNWYLRNTYCSALPLSLMAPHSAIADIQQQASTSSARLPLLVIRALIRQHRVIPR